MLLPSLISLRRLTDEPLAPEDIFGSSLGGIFTDDLQNQHGDDPDTVIVYKNAKHGKLEFRTANVNGEDQRRKFAHYLWNAGILIAELLCGRVEDSRERERDSGAFEKDREDGHEDGRGWKDAEWWTSKEEEKMWSVQGETVLELGAGVGLGGIMGALSGAREVAITDYPAQPILDAISTNLSKNLSGDARVKTSVHGHLWGDFSTDFANANAHRYTRILAADCLWMPHEHDNLARSMLHFLSDSSDARVFVIAGFHTGRARLAPFFEETVPESGLEIEEVYEMNADGERRPWAKERDGGREDIGERKKWLVLARLRRAQR